MTSDLPDLTCVSCEGTGRIGEKWCLVCYRGRRQPTNDEFDAVVARLVEAVGLLREARPWLQDTLLDEDDLDLLARIDAVLDRTAE